MSRRPPTCDGRRSKPGGGAVKGNETKTATRSDNGGTKLSAEDVRRLFEDGYREVEVLANGTVRERPTGGDTLDETVTRSLKTARTWY